MKRSVEFASRRNALVSRIYIVFTHQEADRATPASEYETMFLQMVEDVSIHLDEPAIQVAWLLDQFPGTSVKRAKRPGECALSIQRLADAAADIHFIQPRYPYSLVDSIHMSRKGRVLYGEFIGQFLTEAEGGVFPVAAAVTGFSIRGEVIELTFSNSEPLVFDNSHHPVNNSIQGFNLERPEPGMMILDARIAGSNRVDIFLNKPPTPNSTTALCYACRQRILSEPDTGWPFCAGALREAAAVKSSFYPEEVLCRWLPAFRLPLKTVKGGQNWTTVAPLC